MNSRRIARRHRSITGLKTYSFSIAKKFSIVGVLACTFYSLSSCNSEYVQKPRGFFEIKLPPKKYQQFNQPDYPYTFEYPVYGNALKDSVFFEESAEKYWMIEYWTL